MALEDPRPLADAARRLGPQGLPNTSYPKGLRRALGLPAVS